MPVRRQAVSLLKGGGLKRKRRNRYGQFASNGSGVLVRRQDIARSRARPEAGLLDKGTISSIRALTKGRQQLGQVQIKSARLKTNKPRVQKARTAWSKG